MRTSPTSSVATLASLRLPRDPLLDSGPDDPDGFVRTGLPSGERDAVASDGGRCLLLRHPPRGTRRAQFLGKLATRSASLSGSSLGGHATICNTRHEKRKGQVLGHGTAPTLRDARNASIAVVSITIARPMRHATRWPEATARRTVRVDT